MKFDVRSFLDPDDAWVASEKPRVVERYYADKALVAAMLRPASIAETGVRYGYSAAAFLSAYSCTYIGYDADIAGSGGCPGAFARAKAMLERHFPGRTRLVHADTQKLAALDCGPRSTAGRRTWFT